MTFHRTQLIGNLGDDPELRYGQSGTARATFQVAINDRWKDASGQQQEHTEWYRLVAWGRLGELAGEHLHKGNRIFAEGKLRTRSWQDDSGQSRYMTELHVETVEFLDERRTMAAPGRDEMVEP